MITKYIRIPMLIATILTPAFALAADSFNVVINTLKASINIVIVFLFLVATVIFLWGVVRYISAGGDEAKTEEARNMIIWGIIFLAVMVAVWGFVYVVLDFIFGTERSVPIPREPNVPQQ